MRRRAKQKRMRFSALDAARAQIHDQLHATQPRPTNLALMSHNFRALSVSLLSSESSFSKEPFSLFQLQYTPDRSSSGLDTTCKYHTEGSWV